MKTYIVNLIYGREFLIKADRCEKEGDRHVFYTDAGARVDDVLCEIVSDIRTEDTPVSAPSVSPLLAIHKDTPETIGSPKVIVAINAAAIAKLRSGGLEIQDMLALILTEKSPQSELVSVSQNTLQLFPSVKQRCLNTPVYQSDNGGIVVTDRKLDDHTMQGQSLSFIGMVDPQHYAAALCVRFGLQDKEILV